MQREDEIADLGGKVIAIGNGTADHARHFLESEDVDIEVYVDPERTTYKAFDMKRGPQTVTGLKTMKHGARAAAKGFMQTATRGSTTQIGGVLVVDEDGSIVFEHIESEAGDIADYDAVIAALR